MILFIIVIFFICFFDNFCSLDIIRQNLTQGIFYNYLGGNMDKIIISIILIIFPILMYLVFSCYNLLVNSRIEKIVFIITILTSFYLSIYSNYCEYEFLIFCNIPVLTCYFKKEGILGVILSIIVIIFSYLKYDINIYIAILKYLGYLITYIFLYKKKEFNYLFFKISAIIQGFFLSFEYFMASYYGINKIIEIFTYILIVYGLTFFSLYLFKLASNISNLYLMVNKVNEENKLKNSLFKLTHEIKNPIAVCKGYLDMINLDDVVKSRKYVNIIKGEIDRSLNVIADFMEYSKIKINKEEFDMVMLLDEVYESFEMLMKDKKINFVYDNSYDEIYMNGDYERLKQVFVNVIKNSIESIEDNGIIKMIVSVCGDKVIIAISDNGIGMDKETLDNVYEMFYTTKRNGTGLGVALSNEIILAHNGTLKYESEVGNGTKCIINLPI